MAQRDAWLLWVTMSLVAMMAVACVPEEWSCDDAAFGDGVCDCGCGDIDKDCANDERLRAPLPDTCERTHCPEGEAALDTWVAACTPSCAGICDQDHPSGACACSHGCWETGDCCEDYDTLCYEPIIEEGCGTESAAPADVAATEERWRQEAPALEERSGAATIAVQYDDAVFGLDSAPVRARGVRAFAVPGAPTGDDILFIDGAETESGRGLLLVEGTRIEATVLLMEGAGVRADASAVEGYVAVTLVGVPLEDFDLEAPPSWQDAESVAFFGLQEYPSAGALELVSFTRASLLTDGGATIDLDAPIFVDGYDRLMVSGRFDGLTLEAAEVEVESGAWAFSATGAGGGVTFDDDTQVTMPELLAGLGALIIRPDSVVADDVRVTQMIVAGQPQLPATLEVAFGEARTRHGVSWHYVPALAREPAGMGDALVTDVQIAGCAADNLRLPLSLPPRIDAVASEDAAPQSIPQALTEAIASFLSGLSCALNSCPRPAPLPAWLGAGDVVPFELLLYGEGLEAGRRYPTAITLEGHDFVTTVEVDVIVDPDLP